MIACNKSKVIKSWFLQYYFCCDKWSILTVTNNNFIFQWKYNSCLLIKFYQLLLAIYFNNKNNNCGFSYFLCYKSLNLIQKCFNKQIKFSTLMANTNGNKVVIFLFKKIIYIKKKILNHQKQRWKFTYTEKICINQNNFIIKFGTNK